MVERFIMFEEKRKLKLKCFEYLGSYGENIRTKFSNICNKTGMYNVPEELFQKRTPRKNRVLISWKTVKKNNLNIEKLESFENGVVVEFMNNDYLDDDNQNDPVFIELKNRLGSNKNVSSIITFRTENGSSSSSIPRIAFSNFINNTEVIYNDNKIIINKNNYMNYALEKTLDGSGSGIGNDKWKGFLFVSIKGGQQATIETHKNKSITLFNPACEYASKEVSIDIDLTLSYFAMCSIDYTNLPKDKKNLHINLLTKLEEILKNIEYELNNKKISLFQYCNMHPSLAISKNKLIDPIQMKEISISNFDVASIANPESIDITHNEAVNKELYYWDSERKCILSPARPTNLFWSYHLSNMMQQNFSLSDYINHEEEIYKKRQEFRKNFDFTEDI